MSANRLRKGDGVPYTQINNEILYSPDLSLKAKGLYAFMYAKPDDWNFTASSMASQLKEGKRAILNILNELKEFGLLDYKKLNSGRGVYTIYSSPIPKNKPKCQNSTLQETSQSAKTAPCRKRTVQKQHRINNKDTYKNKDFNNNPDSGDFKKSSLGLPTEVQSYRKKLLDMKQEGLIGHFNVEGKFENVYIDAEGKLYTDSRSNKQIVTSTLKELWCDIYEYAKLMSSSNQERLQETLGKLGG